MLASIAFPLFEVCVTTFGGCPLVGATLLAKVDHVQVGYLFTSNFNIIINWVAFGCSWCHGLGWGATMGW